MNSMMARRIWTVSAVRAAKAQVLNRWRRHSGGVMYALGMGVLQDAITAHIWFNITAANGYADVGKNRDVAASKLSSADIVEAQKRAKRCMASGYRACD
jgi:hypothetical protein